MKEKLLTSNVENLTIAAQDKNCYFALERSMITVIIYEFHETCHSVTFYFMKKKDSIDAVTPQH